MKFLAFSFFVPTNIARKRSDLSSNAHMNKSDPVFLRPVAHTGAVFIVALSVVFVCAFCLAQGSSSAGTTTFVFDGNRMYAELGFRRPDGSIHRALAFVDMGSPSMTLTASLFKALELDQNKPLVFRVGELSVGVPRAAVSSERSEPHSIGSDLEVEGMLPAGILQRYQVVIDYQKRTLALARARTPTPQGVPVPFHINRETGLIAVDGSIDGKLYPMTIDNGSAYTWFRHSTATRWHVSHPDWERGVGAVGASNMMMSGDGTETSGTLLRIPEISLGPLILKDVGVLAAGPGRSFAGNLDLFDWYSQKNAVPVIGWIGGNVLKAFRLTIDYPNQMTYWLKQSDPDSDDLDQVGLTLRADHGTYIVAGVATKKGRPTVEGVLPGDRLIRVGALDLGTATWGAIYNAMHGRPGESRSLILERNGNRLAVAARVTAF
jgi:hypothetical protein